MALFRKHHNTPNDTENEKEGGSHENAEVKARLKRGTKLRRATIGVVIFFYFLAIIFLILVRTVSLCFRQPRQLTVDAGRDWKY